MNVRQGACIAVGLLAADQIGFRVAGAIMAKDEVDGASNFTALAKIYGVRAVCAIGGYMIAAAIIGDK